LRRSTHKNVGARHYNEAYEWNLMSLSVGMAIQSFWGCSNWRMQVGATVAFQRKEGISTSILGQVK